jgi:hypothetical protein
MELSIGLVPRNRMDFRDWKISQIGGFQRNHGLGKLYIYIFHLCVFVLCVCFAICLITCCLFFPSKDFQAMSAPRYRLGVALSALGRLSEAQEALGEALQRRPEDADVPRWRAEVAPIYPWWC